MHVVIIGAGNVGTLVFGALKKYGYTVTIIEKCKKLADSLKNSGNFNVIIGDGCDPEILKIAGIENASHIMSFTGEDTTNIMCCKIANIAFNVPISIARIRSKFLLKNEIYNLFSKENLAVDIIIDPERELVNSLYELTVINGAHEVLHIGNISVAGVICKQDSDILDASLLHLKNVIKDINIRIISIIKNGNIILDPILTETINAGNKVYFAVPKKDLSEIIKLFGYENELERVTIIGADRPGRMLARKLIENGITVTLIDKSEEKLQKLSDININLICSDANNIGNLSHYDIQSMDVVVSMTSDDKLNVITSILSHKMGVARSICLSNCNFYNSLTDDNSGPIFIHSADITAHSVLKHTHGGNIGKKYHLRGIAGYIVEIKITDSCAQVENCISKIYSKKSIMPLLIENDNGIFVPHNNYIMSSDDKLTLFVDNNALKKVDKIFSNFSFYKKNISY